MWTLNLKILERNCKIPHSAALCGRRLDPGNEPCVSPGTSKCSLLLCTCTSHKYSRRTVVGSAESIHEESKGAECGQARQRRRGGVHRDEISTESGPRRRVASARDLVSAARDRVGRVCDGVSEVGNDPFQAQRGPCDGVWPVRRGPLRCHAGPLAMAGGTRFASSCSQLQSPALPPRMPRSLRRFCALAAVPGVLVRAEDRSFCALLEKRVLSLLSALCVRCGFSGGSGDEAAVACGSSVWGDY